MTACVNCWLFTAFAILISAYLVRKFLQGRRFEKAVRCDGKIILITGANSGIGKETALELAKRGGTIYMACLPSEKLLNNEACDYIKTTSGNQNVFVRELDLASFESIRNFAERFKTEVERLDILINNAGVYGGPLRFTHDGLEMHFGVNYIGHFLLTNLLLDYIKHSEPSRIINVSSLLYPFGRINKNDINNKSTYHHLRCYCQSKLALILFTKELSRKLQTSNAKVTVNVLNPGAAKSQIRRNEHYLIRLLFMFFELFIKTSNAAAQTYIYAALDPDLDTVTGKYFDDCKVKSVTKTAEDENLSKWLWDMSEKLTGLSTKMQ